MHIEKPEVIVFFGGGQLMIDLPVIALDKGYEVLVFAVKRHLDEEVARGKSLACQLQKEGITFYQQADINLAPQLQELKNRSILGIGIGENYTFAQKTIEIFNGQIFDLMTINLPQYRGGAHFTWQILRKEKIGAWKLQEINEYMVPGKFDSGRIVDSMKFKLPKELRIPKDYFVFYNTKAKSFFKNFLANVDAAKEFDLSILDESESSFFPRQYSLIQAFINWNWSAEEIERFICAFDQPYSGAMTFLNNSKVYLGSVHLSKSEASFHPYMSGLIYRASEEKVFVCGNGGSLEISDIRDSSGESIILSTLVGSRFFTPSNSLEQSLSYCAEYDENGLVKK